MTAPKVTLRQRRRNSAESLPKDLAEWFAGARRPDPEPPQLVLSPAQRACLERMPERSLSRMERRALGATVEPEPSSAPWSALIYPDFQLLPERWQIWKAAHPDARPPAGYEWLADPTSPRHPSADDVALARKCARRGR